MYWYVRKILSHRKNLSTTRENLGEEAYRGVFGWGGFCMTFRHNNAKCKMHRAELITARYAPAYRQAGLWHISNAKWRKFFFWKYYSRTYSSWTTCKCRPRWADCSRILWDTWTTDRIPPCWYKMRSPKSKDEHRGMCEKCEETVARGNS